KAKAVGGKVPLYFDVKSRQMRIAKVYDDPKKLVMELNHPIFVNTPTPVLFKAGEDMAILDHVSPDGKVLTFQGGPRYMVK
ncbi:hypothetical protein ACE40V_24725, partial [Salmonella enterica]|uniref:hypothetical protein n=1 Tax=Salmonella enterica TaxID=28901 RepID=UPI003D26E252